MTEETKEKFSELDKYYSESLEDLTATIEQVKVMARDSVNEKER